MFVDVVVDYDGIEVGIGFDVWMFVFFVGVFGFFGISVVVICFYFVFWYY